MCPNLKSHLTYFFRQKFNNSTPNTKYRHVSDEVRYTLPQFPDTCLPDMTTEHSLWNLFQKHTNKSKNSKSSCTERTRTHILESQSRALGPRTTHWVEIEAPAPKSKLHVSPDRFQTVHVSRWKIQVSGSQRPMWQPPDGPRSIQRPRFNAFYSPGYFNS